MGDISGHDDHTGVQAFQSTELSSGWIFKQTDDLNENGWMSVKKVPSTVHQDLIDNGRTADTGQSNRLEHPFVGFNELKAEWVGTKSWTYRTNFHHEKRAGVTTVLMFEGLDTFATVKINGKIVHQSDNMFLPFRVDITEELDRVSSCNMQQLEVVFEPALIKAREIMAQHPEHKFICSNGEPARLAARKAQYHWGWDWGPVMMCCGIWRPVRLETYMTSKIAKVRTDMDIAKDHSKVTIKVTVDIYKDERGSDIPLHLACNLRYDGKSVHVSQSLLVSHRRTAIGIHIRNPRLWMPCGYGEQALYDLEVSLIDPQTGLVIDSQTKRIGLRKVELVQQMDKHGKSFYFTINGVEIFCGGSCWIPADSFLTNILPERYKNWISLMVPGNQKMIRVWGGGIYEDDAFYDACDELGIMVWQDFMFGCGNYPTFPSMLRSIKSEAIANVRRIRHHPSIVIFAGNNEDYQIAEQNGLTYNYDDKDEESWLKTDFPARFIYESLLPKVIAAECPSIPYHPGSPWGDGRPTSDPTVGDLHQWNVWHGTQEKYQIFDTLGGRFNSEFGMEAFPHVQTIKSYVENATDLYPQSRSLDFHNKADGHERRIATYLVENVRTTTDLEAYIHLTQLIQCEALMFGYRGWRKQWGDDRRCGGALVWQLNDCWPGTSWSICDYVLRRKPAYYAMARILAPIAVGIQRQHHDWSVTHARDAKTLTWELWAVSSRRDEMTISVEVRFISVASGQEIKDRFIQHNIILTPNGTTAITHGLIDNTTEEPHVLAARLMYNGRIVARDTDWPQPLKYLQFPKRNVRVSCLQDKIHVTVDRPVKCLVFEERQGCHLSDSALDLVPGDEQVLTVRGLKPGDQPLKWTYLGAGEQ